MLPLQQALEVQFSIEAYLKATFEFQEPAVAAAFHQFLHDPQEGVFKGPYLSVRLPFRAVPSGTRIPLEIGPSFPPYAHQFKAFERLSSQADHQPEPTLITTGTGSGKTECFLYPVLDYCYQQRHRPGIKVIILYPMNALATDQAKRFAEAIWSDERLRGTVRAGLFIGAGKKHDTRSKTMGADHVVEDRQTIVDSPPDILLTNFKMLDYGLLRAEYHSLWANNLADPDLLSFLVLDELHTYDGAQGTDVANLLRRLHLKLNIPAGQICPVGTSATLGEGSTAREQLRTYASRIFGVPFLSDECLIGEDRLSVAEFLSTNEHETLDKRVPLLPNIARAVIAPYDTYESYLKRQCELWGLPSLVSPQIDGGASAIALGQALRGLRFVYELLRLAREKQGLPTLADLTEGLLQVEALSAFHSLPSLLPRPGMPGEVINPRHEVLGSLLSLLAAARAGDPGKKQLPLVQVQAQLWIRELRTVMRELTQTPRFAWPRHSIPTGSVHALPPWYCRECGASGWLALKTENSNTVSADVKRVYDSFFARDRNVWLMSEITPHRSDEYTPTDSLDRWIDPVTLQLHHEDDEERPRLEVVLNRVLDDHLRRRDVCPSCASTHNPSLVGSRVPTLSSIAVSQTLSSDLDPREDKTRKVLAFTNAVQDAAHQAGFVQARNYRFTFRASLQHVLNLQPGNEPVSLPELEEAFQRYWKKASDPTGQENEEAYYYRFFPSDYAGKADLSTDYREDGKLTKSFKEEFDLRMSWDIRAEFGYNARVGRTLEKTGAAGVVFDEHRVHSIYERLLPWLVRNEMADQVNADSFPAFLSGLLHRIRIRGGVDHPYLVKYRTVRVESFQLNWYRDPKHFLNRLFGPRTRPPRLFTTEAPGGATQWVDTSHGRGQNWSSRYFARAFPDAAPGLEAVREFYSALFQELERAELVNARNAAGLTTYCLEPASLRVMNRVVELQCPVCTSILWVGAADTVSAGAPCLTYRCQGRYGNPTPSRANYYQAVYNRQRSPRIYAAEHTGLLPRATREKLEVDFKTRPHYNSRNALVATSTLEMGIDIGTLNVVLLNSVPPQPANYLQRVGRAGRSTGSALVVTFAQGQGHDLFYFAEPRAMMAGDITPPGCFLEARDILSRHFFAFCLDCWASADPNANIIPGRLRLLQVESANLQDPTFLANRIIAFISQNVSELLFRFEQRYISTDHSPAGGAMELAFDELKDSVSEGILLGRFRQSFERVKLEYQQIRKRRQEITTKISKLGREDSERIALEADKKALGGLRKLLNQRSVLEYLTNAGLLPNYAFPETGVTLAGQVRASRAKGSDNVPERQDFEIVRPASQALRELAPDTLFYAQGYHFRVSGLNTADWGSQENLLRKRFCSRCDHLEEDVLAHATACPKCGDPAWSSSQNVHHFVKLTAVRSTDRREEATLDDGSDERDAERYRISQHLHFRPDGFQGAWGTATLPFGFEYNRQVKVTTVNLGNQQAHHSNAITINGKEEVPHHGFVTCSHCGKSTSKPRSIPPPEEATRNRDRFHYGWCPQAPHEYAGHEDEVFREVYLFTSTTTEALRILLPVQEFEAEASVSMFEAGLTAALRRYYQGSPAHITCSPYREHNLQSGRFDHYLVLHDTIPGGTGYLATLFQPSEFTKLLQLAYEGVRDCGCQHTGKDGCYRCIYSYANQREHPNLSRQRGEALFARIVESALDWRPYPTGLSGASGTGKIEESELEDRFIRVLRRAVEQRSSAGWKLTNKIVDGEYHYDLRVVADSPKQKVELDYRISPQVPLGQAQNVKLYTKSDFYFRLLAAKVNGKEVADFTVCRDLALYLDGYTYHATHEILRFFGDVDKRVAINASGDKTTWTLTWADLDLAEAEKEVNQRDELWSERQDRAFTSTLQALRKRPQFNRQLADAPNSWERFLWYLAHPLPQQQAAEGQAILLSLFQARLGKPSIANTAVSSYLHFKQEVNPDAVATGAAQPYLVTKELSTHFSDTRTVVSPHNWLAQGGTRLLREQGSALDKGQWEKFWHLYNLIQRQHLLIESSTSDSDDWEVLLSYYDEDLHDLIRLLIKNGIDFGSDGSYFVSHEGQEAESALGFTAAKLFIRPLSQADRDIFIAAGYHELAPADFTLDLLTVTT